MKKQPKKKSKAKGTKEAKSLDVLDIIETEEAKRKEKAESKPVIKPKKTKEQAVNKEKPIKDTSHQLPKAVADRKIVCHEVSETMTSKVELADITSTSKQIYVDDIHCANPTVLQTIYWVIMPNCRLVVARVTEDEYNYVVKKLGKNHRHHVSVVDCSVIPTLTYGSWQSYELTGDFPTPEQIEEKDKEFKKNPTRFHNPPVKIEIYEEQQKEIEKEEQALEAQKEAQEKKRKAKKAAAIEDDTSEEDEEFDFDFGEDEEEFDFSEAG